MRGLPVSQGVHTLTAVCSYIPDRLRRLYHSTTVCKLFRAKLQHEAETNAV